jgi:hypothetical protein
VFRSWYAQDHGILENSASRLHLYKRISSLTPNLTHSSYSLLCELVLIPLFPCSSSMRTIPTTTLPCAVCFHNHLFSLILLPLKNCILYFFNCDIYKIFLLLLDSMPRATVLPRLSTGLRLFIICLDFTICLDFRSTVEALVVWMEDQVHPVYWLPIMRFFQKA